MYVCMYARVCVYACVYACMYAYMSLCVMYAAPHSRCFAPSSGYSDYSPVEGTSAVHHSTVAMPDMLMMMPMMI